MGRIDDKFVLNPTYVETEKSAIDLVVVGNRAKVIMIEGKFKEVSEELAFEAIRFAFENIQSIISLQEDFSAR